MDSKRTKTQAIVGGAVAVVAAAALIGIPSRKVAAIDPPPDIVDVPVVPTAPLPPTPTPPDPTPHFAEDPPAMPTVEIVFVLDTTGSMTGLIASAKEKIWSIANHVASAQPTPHVRIGLVAYRDNPYNGVADAYVTQDFPLSSDLDAVFAQLSSFTAEGGGDLPEQVNKGLFDAVHKMAWSPGAMKMIFLVGDAPPHMDYNDGYDYHKIVREAAADKIVVNAIRCGKVKETEAPFREIASLGQGTYASIAQEGGVATIATPMDKDLARLGGELSDTTVVYGDEATHRAYAHKLATTMAAPAPAAADRSGYYAHSGAGLDDNDIVEKATRGTVDVTKLDPAKLPAAMGGLDAEGRRAYVAAKETERQKVRQQIVELAAKRDAYLKAQPTKADGFDGVVDQAINEQGKGYGLKF